MVNNVWLIARVMLLPAQAWGALDQDQKSLESVTTPFLLRKALDRIGLARI